MNPHTPLTGLLTRPLDLLDTKWRVKLSLLCVSRHKSLMMVVNLIPKAPDCKGISLSFCVVATILASTCTLVSILVSSVIILGNGNNPLSRGREADYRNIICTTQLSILKIPPSSCFLNQLVCY